MTSYKIVGFPKTSNTNKAAVVAKYVGASLDIETCEMGKTNRTAEFLAKFPFGKVPVMHCPEGPLFESNAIAYYLASSKKSELLGKDAYEQALVIQYICSLDCELTPAIASALYPLMGYRPYDAAVWRKDFDELLNKLKVYDAILQPRTYFIGESITLADLIFTCALQPVFGMLLEESHRKKLVNLTRWYVTLANQPNVHAVLGELKLCVKTAEAPKPAASAQPAVARHAVATAEDDEDEPAPKPKEKNALDLLPPTKLNLEEWKRFYSNNDAATATKWFWDNFDSEGFSIWRADYLYNDELKLIFMTSNLVTGLFQRMDAVRKYCFAVVLICGENNKNNISGYFVFRGKEIPDMMKEVPDFDCYQWKRMDINDKSEHGLFGSYLAREGTINGQEIAASKVFK